MITKAELEHGAYYDGHCRNAQVARWNAQMNCFVHWRYKFGQTFLEEIRHPEDEHHFDVFHPFRKIDKPDDIKEINFGDL